MTVQYEASQKTVQRLEKPVSDFHNNSELLSLDAQLQKQSETVQSLEKEVAEKDQELRELRELGIKMEAELAEERQKALKELRELSIRMEAELEGEKEKALKELRELRVENSAAAGAIEDMRLQAQALEKDKKKIETDLAHKQEQLQWSAQELEVKEQKCNQKTDEIQKYKKALYQAEAAATESDAELSKCRKRLVEEGQEMEIMMEEVAELQKAVLMQTNQHVMLNAELLQAKSRIAEMEENGQESLRPLISDKRFARVLGWLDITGKKEKTLDIDGDPNEHSKSNHAAES